MNATQPETPELIRRARDGDRQALGQLLDEHRAYLQVLAQRQIDPRLGARLDASDLVQQTCLSALKRIEQFAGSDSAEFLAWLRTIHEHNIQNAARDHLQRQKRAAGRDASLEGAGGDQFAGLTQSSPTQRLMQGEDAVRLAQALQMLPEDQREAVRLRHLEGWSLAQIAEHLDRSTQAAAGLIKRGLVGLRQQLKTEDEP
jgi:RNA polymerase sigma-70 factor (ECF subfamily)